MRLRECPGRPLLSLIHMQAGALHFSLAFGLSGLRPVVSHKGTPSTPSRSHPLGSSILQPKSIDIESGNFFSRLIALPWALAIRMGSTRSEAPVSMFRRGWSWSLASLVVFLCASVATSTNEVHIVYMGSHHAQLPKVEVTGHHHRILAEALGSAEAVEDSMIYSYNHLFSGFAARLSPEQIEFISRTEGVMSVFPSTVHQTQTTHTWNFLGLDKLPLSPTEDDASNAFLDLLGPTIWSRTNFGSDAIIAVIDTGVWPESHSFHDEGLDEVPSRFNGTCEVGDSFPASSCNKKLIGARYYNKGFEATIGKINLTEANETLSPRDAHGHGTHTASTAAGRFTPNVSEMGWALGTAKGGAPFARLAVYKACWPVTAGDGKGGATCSVADVMKAMDDAWSDGVDVMSLSIGGSQSVPYFEDGIAVAAYHAAAAGVVLVTAAGNSGPNMSTVANLQPWTMTVAASTIDRDFRESITLGNQMELFGYTQGVARGKNIFHPLVFAGDVALPHADKENASLCVKDTLDPAKVRGKVVLCLRGLVVRIEKSLEVIRGGGEGIIVANTNASDDLIKIDPIPLLGCNVEFQTEQALLAYINSTRNPTIKFGQKNFLGVEGSPSMTIFSSVGPNMVVPDILKPDITAPGELVLAAWTENALNEARVVVDGELVTGQYKLESGTSMATPHVSGIAALLKSLHPHWSPAAIKSAIMTTASVVDNIGQPIKDYFGHEATAFHYGAGMVNPNAAADPGLVYDTNQKDYLVFLCALGYNSTHITIVTGIEYTCPNSNQTPRASDLNLPSVTIANLENKRTIKRTVTNVGSDRSVYKFESSCPSNTRTTVFPTELHFKRLYEKKSFYITFERTAAPTEEWSFGSFTWYDDANRYRVRSPVVLGVQLTTE